MARITTRSNTTAANGINMARWRGGSPRGRRLIEKAPHGHWRTMTFLAALRVDRIEAPCVIDGPINGDRFTTYVERFLAYGSGSGSCS